MTLTTMKRLIAIVALVLVTIGSASAQKKDVALLSEELNAVKAREAVLQHKVDSLAVALESNKQLMAQMTTLFEAYNALSGAYTTNSEELKSLGTKLDALIAALEPTSESTPEQSVETSETPDYTKVGDICSGVALVREGFYYGYVNGQGEYVIPAQYEEARSFSEGYAAVKKDGKWGYINPKGEFVIAAQFEQAFDFGENTFHGMARVKINGKWGVIRPSGAYVVAAKYDYIQRYSSYGEQNYICVLGENTYRLYRNGTIEEW